MRISGQGIRLAVRSFIRNPGFATIAVLSLGLGIALNTTMYSVIDALVNPRVDMHSPDKLYLLSVWGDRFRRVPNGAVEELLKSGGRTYAGYTGSQRKSSFFTGDAVEYKRRYDQARSVAVRPNYFELLGIRAAAGRTLTEADYAANSNVVVISDRLAGSLFPDGDSPLGKVIDVNGDPHTVVGVLGRASNFPGDRTDL